MGLSFIFGIPLGAKLSTDWGLKFPLYLAVSFCILNCFLIALFLPESMKVSEVKKKVNWLNANPTGALHMLFREPKLRLGSIVYLLLNIAHGAMSITWMNYLQHKFHWTPKTSGITMVIVGLVVAILPQMVIPIFGLKTCIQYGLLLHSVSLFFVGSATKPYMIFLGMPFLAAGASSLPMLLGCVDFIFFSK